MHVSGLIGEFFPNKKNSNINHVVTYSSTEIYFSTDVPQEYPVPLENKSH